MQESTRSALHPLLLPEDGVVLEDVQQLQEASQAAIVEAIALMESRWETVKAQARTLYIYGLLCIRMHCAAALLKTLCCSPRCCS